MFSFLPSQFGVTASWPSPSSTWRLCSASSSSPSPRSLISPKCWPTLSAWPSGRSSPTPSSSSYQRFVTGGAGDSGWCCVLTLSCSSTGPGLWSQIRQLRGQCSWNIWRFLHPVCYGEDPENVPQDGPRGKTASLSGTKHFSFMTPPYLSFRPYTCRWLVLIYWLILLVIISDHQDTQFYWSHVHRTKVRDTTMQVGTSRK